MSALSGAPAGEPSSTHPVVGMAGEAAQGLADGITGFLDALPQP